MKKKLLALLSITILSGCSMLPKATSRSDSNQAAVTVTTTRTALIDNAAGNNAAIAYVSGTLPASRAKDVISIFVGDQYRLLGLPSQPTQTSFEKTAKELLASDPVGESDHGKLVQDSTQKQIALTKAEEDFKALRIREEADHKAELEKVKLEASQAQKKFISYIFFGGGALLLGLGVVVLLTASSVPMFGPKVGFGLLIAGGGSIGMGITVLQLMAELDKHPAILWIGLVFILGILTAVGALLYANHQHHVTQNGSTRV